MAQARKKSSGRGRTKKTLVRGADGSLYVLSQRDLKPFKVHERKAKQLDKLLKSAKKSPSVNKLSATLVKQIGKNEGCVATHDEIHINT